LDAGRQCRLRHGTRLRGAAEMPFARQRQQKFELVDHPDGLLGRTGPLPVGQKYTRNGAISDRRLLSPYSIFAIVCTFKPLQIRRGGQVRMNMQAKPPVGGGRGTGGRRRPPRTPKGRQVDLEALEEVRALLTDRPRRRDLLIEHLHLVQDHYGHLSAAHLTALAAEMKMALTEVYEVATFYSH